jgi:hypothetical protein
MTEADIKHIAKNADTLIEIIQNIKTTNKEDQPVNIDLETGTTKLKHGGDFTEIIEESRDHRGDSSWWEE